jgi:hypothetical protein
MHDWAEADALADLEVEEGVFEAGHVGNNFRGCSRCVMFNAGSSCVVVQVMVGCCGCLPVFVGLATSPARWGRLGDHASLGATISTTSKKRYAVHVESFLGWLQNLMQLWKASAMWYYVGCLAAL